MPELPEVETTRRGIAPHIEGQRISKMIVRDRRLRWPVARGIEKKLTGQKVIQVRRRAKYLLIDLDNAHLILHLGMSGSLRIVKSNTPAGKHDHIDIIFSHGDCLRFTDPRRFGSIHFTTTDPLQHKLLKNLGPEPVDRHLAEHLYEQSRKRKLAVKLFIMNSQVVVGIGNIYASEALFCAGIRPGKASGRLTRKDCERLARCIKDVINKAIRAGGTTLRDFTRSDGQPGYFAQQLKVYGKAGEPCPVCGTTITRKVLGQRSTYYCRNCQS